MLGSKVGGCVRTSGRLPLIQVVVPLQEQLTSQHFVSCRENDQPLRVSTIYVGFHHRFTVACGGVLQGWPNWTAAQVPIQPGRGHTKACVCSSWSDTFRSSHTILACAPAVQGGVSDEEKWGGEEERSPPRCQPRLLPPRQLQQLPSGQPAATAPAAAATAAPQPSPCCLPPATRLPRRCTQGAVQAAAVRSGGWWERGRHCWEQGRQQQPCWGL